VLDIAATGAVIFTASTSAKISIMVPRELCWSGWAA
jgi:hypothetical protein